MFYIQLKKICEINNTTISAVAKKFNLSTSTATNWKTGTSPRSEVVKAIANYFNVSTDYLINENYSITDDEQELLTLYRKLSDTEKAKEIELLRKLLYVKS